MCMGVEVSHRVPDWHFVLVQLQKPGAGCQCGSWDLVWIGSPGEMQVSGVYKSKYMWDEN